MYKKKVTHTGINYMFRTCSSKDKDEHIERFP